MRGFRSILCVLESGDERNSAYKVALALAKSSGARISVVSVLPASVPRAGAADEHIEGGDLQRALVREQQDYLRDLVKSGDEQINVECKVLVGISFVAVVREVLRHGHDLVIKSRLPRSWLRQHLAGNDMHLLRECPCPVWLLSSAKRTDPKRILATIDVDDCHPTRDLDVRRMLNEQVIEMATSVALQQFAELQIAYAWQSVNELAQGLVFSSGIGSGRWVANVEEELRDHQKLLDDAISGMRENNPQVREALDFLKPSVRLLKGPAPKEIPDLARQLEIDCIVMGTVARTGIRGFFMGNTAEEIIGQIDCSILAIKPHGFVSSVAVSD